MKYSLFKLTKEEQMELLDYFSETMLSEPISKNQKNFENDIKGFRPNKLPIAKLKMIYSRDVNNVGEKLLREHVEFLIKKAIESTEVETILANYKGNLLALLCSVKLELTKNNIKIPMKYFVLTSEVELSDEERIEMFSVIETLNLYEDCISGKFVVESQEIREQIKGLKDKNATDKNAYKEHIKTQEVLLSELKTTITEKNNLLNKAIEENKSLKDEIKTKGELIEKNNEDMNRLTERLKDREKELLAFKADLKHANEQIELQKKEMIEISTHPFTGDEIIKMLKETEEDVISSSVEFDTVLKLAKEQFQEDISLLEGWDELYNKSKKELETIYNAMKDNNINDNLIENLDSIENDVLIKYYLIKNLKVLFFNNLAEIEKQKKPEDSYKTQ